MGIGVTYHSGTFSETLPKFKEDIDILHLDCDLYQSYLDVLDNIYDNVKETGSVIFDEYYSFEIDSEVDLILLETLSKK